jgi:hypothetical protein
MWNIHNVGLVHEDLKGYLVASTSDVLRFIAGMEQVVKGP